MPTDPGAAGDADATGQRAVGADADVMRDLNLVVQLDPVLDHGIFQRAAIDGGVGADLDIIADHARCPVGEP